MENVLEMKIYYDTESKHLLIDDKSMGIHSKKLASKEIQEYFERKVTQIEFARIVGKTLQ